MMSILSVAAVDNRAVRAKIKLNEVLWRAVRVINSDDTSVYSMAHGNFSIRKDFIAKSPRLTWMEIYFQFKLCTNNPPLALIDSASPTLSVCSAGTPPYAVCSLPFSAKVLPPGVGKSGIFQRRCELLMHNGERWFYGVRPIHHTLISGSVSIQLLQIGSLAISTKLIQSALLW